ncbi:hypothetical protein, partial [Methylocystis suflitae]|uniref:hypothetical protein n=1 Tax=Methylocystis suflitae TaxID=2951405 RepID=UPI00210D4075
KGGQLRMSYSPKAVAISKSEPDPINPVVSTPDQTHIRSPFTTAAPISRLQRVGLRKTGPFCWSAF